MWEDIISQRNAKIAELIQSVAQSDSSLLKAHLNGLWYRQQNQDVVRLGKDLVEHWFTTGVHEGRIPALDPIALVQELIREREQSLQTAIAEKDRQLAQAEYDVTDKQKALAAELAQTKLKLRYEVDTQMRTLAERERQLNEQFEQLQHTVSLPNAEQQIAELTTKLQRSEQLLQATILEKDRDLQQFQRTALVRQKALEAELGQAKLRAHNELEAQTRMLAERERVFAKQIIQFQHTASQERATQQKAVQQQLAHGEQTLRIAMVEKERQLRQLQVELQERQQAMDAEKDEVLAKACAELQANLQKLAERERTLENQFLQKEQVLQNLITEKDQELRLAHQEAKEQLKEHAAEIAQTKLKARNEIDTHLRALAERERAFSEQFTAFQQAAKAELLEQQQAAKAELLEHQQSAKTELLEQQQTAKTELIKQQQAAQQQLALLSEQFAASEQALRASLAEKEFELRQIQQEAALNQRTLQTELNASQNSARIALDAQLQKLAERERVFADQLAQLQHLASQEQAALKDHYIGIIIDLNNRLAAVQATWSWLLTAPLRLAAIPFGLTADFSPISHHQLTMLVAPEQATATATSGDAADKSQSVAINSGVALDKITPATSLNELLGHEQGGFVTCAYLTLLGRRPDPQGYAYYLGRLNQFGDKQAILYQIYKGQEARQFNCQIPGLAAAMQRVKWQQLPIVKNFSQVLTQKSRRNQMLYVQQAVVRHLGALETNISDRLKIDSNGLPEIGVKLELLSKSFDGEKYLALNPDVAETGMNPFEHYMRYGWQEGRKIADPDADNAPPSKGANQAPKQADAPSSQAQQASDVQPSSEQQHGIIGYFLQPADGVKQFDGYTFTRLMRYIWASRKDLQTAFDIVKPTGRLEFCNWFLSNAGQEYALTPVVYPKDLLAKFADDGSFAGGVAKSLLLAQVDYKDPAGQRLATQTSPALGANLIGYAFGEFGMGEQVRATARALNTTSAPFCLIDQDVGVHGAGDASVSHWVVDAPQFDTNIFHVNADVFPPLYFKMGGDFFAGRYNIGFWAWELSECPPEFELALNMVDEVWAISNFVADSFKTRSPVPVITMPLSVTVPPLDPAIYNKAYYGFPEDQLLFYFTFDAASYLDRKNPTAVVRAFKLAFPKGDEQVHLLLKTMNTELAGQLWKDVLAEIADDKRISVLSKRLTRSEVLGLNLACDVFVSLHRSEGFGFCVAEAMAYGKPVVVTNYSGTRDFAKEGTACVVNYTLIPVEEGVYPFWQDQVWAEPSIEHAAALMTRLVLDDSYREKIALAGQRYVLENFNEAVIGERYAQRLAELWGARPVVADPAPALTEIPASGTDIAAYFMQPAAKPYQDEAYTFTQLMYYIWITRVDLQKVFDITQPSGRFEYCKWFLCNGVNEYSLTPEVYPKDLLEKLACQQGEVQAKALALLSVQAAGQRQQVSHEPGVEVDGANLVGYAFGGFGMGEHVRMVAKSLKTLELPFCIIDQDVALHGAGDLSVSHWVTDSPRFNTNVFHINADIFPLLYFKFGANFYANRFNIGFWAWELSKCPPEFQLALNMVNEVWAISNFVAEAFLACSPVPVVTMPLAVTVPKLNANYYTKAYYGFPEDKLLFFFTFDAASYLDRKNPIAVVRAFKLAFPFGNENVQLLLKTMNIELAGPLWQKLLDDIGDDPRITILSKKMSRDEVLGLNLASDIFVSLHRSEGFGRCIAEAMAYGKPVIVTNYSGSCDFAKQDTACLVDYRLVPVPEGAYPLGKDQVWAEPDVNHAASLMKKLAADKRYRADIAAAGQRYVLDNFNEAVVGALYAQRLQAIWAQRRPAAPAGIDEPPVASQAIPDNSHDEIVGSVDAPSAQQCLAVSDVLAVEGWAASLQGITKVEVFIDDAAVGTAYYGLLRPDINQVFPQMAHAARSGFCYRVDVSCCSKGAHKLRVIAHSQSQKSQEWVLAMTVADSVRYKTWLAKSSAVYTNKNGSRRYKAKNLISLLLHVDADFRQALLIDTLQSLAAQLFHAKFELVVSAEDSQRQAIMALVGRLGLSSKCRFETTAAHDLTAKINGCRGYFVGQLAVGDVLSAWAIAAVDEAIQANPKMGLVYADEDTVSDGVYGKPRFKPGWSPLFLASYNYIGSAWFADKGQLMTALSSENLLHAALDEHHLLQVLGRHCGVVGHIPSVLLSKNNANSCAVLPVQSKKITFSPAKTAYPKVSIIIPTRLSDLDMIARCFDGLFKLTDYPALEVIVVVNNVKDESLIDSFLSRWPVKVLTWQHAFSWSGVNNLGAAHATGDCLLFMNDDIEPLDKDWLKNMVAVLADKNVGIVGAQLQYPNGTIQHIGINFVQQGSGSRHLFRFCTDQEQDLQWLMAAPREVSAVTGACLLTTRPCFEEAGGFDEALPLVCNDTDFCLQVLAKGYAVIIQPDARLIHYEGVSRAGMPEGEDVALFLKKWHKFLTAGDPYWNPNLDMSRDDWMVDPASAKRLVCRTGDKGTQ